MEHLGGNGASTSGHESPCEDLHLLSGSVKKQASDIAVNRMEIRATQEQVGSILQGVGESAEHAKNAAREAHAARSEVARFRELMHEPINRLVEHYQKHYSDPPPLMDADLPDGIGDDTRTDLMTPGGSVRRYKLEARMRKEAEDARIRLEAEKIVAEKERVAAEQEKVRADIRAAAIERRHKITTAILGSISGALALGIAVATIIAKFIH